MKSFHSKKSKGKVGIPQLLVLDESDEIGGKRE